MSVALILLAGVAGLAMETVGFGPWGVAPPTIIGALMTLTGKTDGDGKPHELGRRRDP